MAGTRDGRPRYEQIAADIRARVMAGQYPPGSQLPSIPTLVVHYSAATATVQRALASLKDEGLVRSEVGKGVYVRERAPLVIDAAAYFMPSPGGYSYRILEVAEVVPPADVAHSLRLEEGKTAVLRHRLTLYGGEPVELVWSYYPVDIARDTELSKRGKIPGGAARLLADLGYPQQDMVDQISVRMPTTGEVEALDLPPYVPVFRQFREITSTDGRPVEVSVMIKGGHLHELRYRQSAR